MDAAQVAHLVTSLQRANIVHYVHVSSTALFVYDYFTTLVDEIRYIWRGHSSWGAGKILFLVVRYITWPEVFIVLIAELFNVSDSVCHGVFTYTTWSVCVGITIAEMVLVLRTWAIWDGKRSVLLLLSLALFAISIGNFAAVGYYTQHTRIVRAADMLPGISGCFVVESTRVIGAGWAGVAAFELIIVVMTLIKAIQHFRNTTSTLLSSLYRDGLLFFICLFAISLLNMVFAFAATNEYTVLLSEPQRTFHAILACRIILNLRSASKRDIANNDTTPSVIPVTASQSFIRMDRIRSDDKRRGALRGQRSFA